MNCSICYDFFDPYESPYKLQKKCCVCKIKMCNTCSHECYVDLDYFDVICSKFCLNKLFTEDQIVLTVDMYVNNSYLFNVTIKIKQYQSELIEYWNHEKAKPIIRQMIDDYLINDIISIILDY